MLVIISSGNENIHFKYEQDAARDLKMRRKKGTLILNTFNSNVQINVSKLASYDIKRVWLIFCYQRRKINRTIGHFVSEMYLAQYSFLVYRTVA